MSRTHPLKFLDRWLGSFLAHLLPRPSTVRAIAPPTTVLLIRPGGIGDAVHLAPAIHALRHNFPNVTIDILAERRNAGAFPLCSGIRRALLYDRPGELLKVLRNRYDVIIDTEQWYHLSAIVARLIRAPVKIGFATNERARLFTQGVPYSHDDYEVDSFLHLLAPLGITADTCPEGGWLRVPEEAARFVASLLGRGGQRPLVVLFPGASIAERRWGTERFRAVTQWCIGQGMRVVVVGGAGERNDGERIVADLDALNLAGRTSLAETAAILERAAVVVSGDSGVLHIAVGLGRPTVSLFGSGIAAKWAPRGPHHVVLNKHLPCSPCTRFGTTPPCPHDNRCMSEIAVDEVTRAIDTVTREP